MTAAGRKRGKAVMISRLLQSFLLALVLSLPGALPVLSQTENKAGAITAMPGAGEDQAIEQRINDIFDELDGLAGISVSVKSGVVNLNGTVTEAVLATAPSGPRRI